MLILETERIILRDFRRDDFDAFYATTTDPEYQKFYDKREMKRPFWQAIFDRILAAAAQPERLMYQLAICLPTGELVGTSGIRIEEPAHQQASFGCAIARDYWGKGYAFEASRYLMAYALDTLPIHRIYAETISENKRARV
ncbi:MAG: GNAT family N-acetyltransferase, partial [Chloroflexi bacterium]|nr:GNAT family N-acetyltransferase [Chloroflexota bacterium]